MQGARGWADGDETQGQGGGGEGGWQRGRGRRGERDWNGRLISHGIKRTLEICPRSDDENDRPKIVDEKTSPLVSF